MSTEQSQISKLKLLRRDIRGYVNHSLVPSDNVDLLRVRREWIENALENYIEMQHLIDGDTASIKLLDGYELNEHCTTFALLLVLYHRELRQKKVLEKNDLMKLRNESIREINRAITKIELAPKAAVTLQQVEETEDDTLTSIPPEPKQRKKRGNKGRQQNSTKTLRIFLLKSGMFAKVIQWERDPEKHKPFLTTTEMLDILKESKIPIKDRTLTDYIKILGFDDYHHYRKEALDDVATLKNMLFVKRTREKTNIKDIDNLYNTEMGMPNQKARKSKPLVS